MPSYIQMNEQKEVTNVGMLIQKSAFCLVISESKVLKFQIEGLNRVWVDFVCRIHS